MSKRKKEIIITTISILVIILIIAVSYGFWDKTPKQGDRNRIVQGCFDMQVKEGVELSLTNAYPMTNEEGMATESYDVTIENKCSTLMDYDLIVNSLSESTLGEEHIRLGVNNSISLLSENEILEKKEAIENVTNSYKVKVGIIVPGAKEEVKLRIWMDQDTSEEDGESRVYKSKVTINGVTANKKLLTTKILDNNTLIEETPDFSKSEPITDSPTGSGMFMAEDDQGTSYYFKGARDELNNNIIFGKDNDGKDLYWKIVRINGDGSIRLILADDQGGYIKKIGDSAYNSYDTVQPKYVGFTYDNDEGKECTHSHPCEVTYTGEFSNKKFNGINSTIKTALEEWYKTTLDKYNSQIEYGTFCNDTSYGSGTEDEYLAFGWNTRSGNPTLQCPDPNNSSGKAQTYGGIYKTKIGLITADEMNMAGLTYLGSSNNNYLGTSGMWWYSMTPSNYRGNAYVTFGTSSGYNNVDPVYSLYGVIPVINLKANTQVKGTGTTDDPFIVQ